MAIRARALRAATPASSPHAHLKRLAFQAGAPLGIMTGYVLAGLLTTSSEGCGEGFGW